MILNGLGASVLWVAQGEYFSKCATESTKGFYFGLFWSWYQGSQILGSFFGGLIFGENYSKTIFFVIMSAIALFATICMGFTRKPYIYQCQYKQSILLSNQELYYTTQTLTPLPEYKTPNQPEETRFYDDILGTLKMLISPKMLRLWPQMLWTGVSISYWSGLLTPIMIM